MMSLKYPLAGLILCVCPWTAQGADRTPNWSKLLGKSDPAVQTEWAQRYEHGEGVYQDYMRAMRLYCAAAQKGYIVAQYQLGWLYANGRGIERDDALAVAWFRLAAARGNPQAKNMLKLLGEPTKAKEARCVFPRSAELDLALSRVSPALRRQVEASVESLAPDFGLDPRLVLAVIQVESGFNPQARSPKNAQGLMQLIPETAERFGVRDIMDPEQNLRGGMAYLRWLLAFFMGDVRLALAGYNAGERTVEQYQGIPPYAETQDYVKKVTRLYGSESHSPVPQVVQPSPRLAALDVR